MNTSEDRPWATFVQSIPRKFPTFKPTGIDACNASDLQRWRQDAWSYPPYQYRLGNLLKEDGHLRTCNADERKLLMFFKVRRTLTCMPTSARKKSRQSLEEERCSLIGN
eukprot:11213685-Karenia_brevis.AAC.1